MALFEREKQGVRLGIGGIDLVHPIDRMPPNRFPYIQNCRAYKKIAVVGRNLLTNALYTLASAVHSLRRMNDSTPNGPSSGYSIINGAGTVLSAWNSSLGVKNVATGLSGNPVSLVPFRPNASVQPWTYVADSAPQGNVTITTEYLINGTGTTFQTNGMVKVSCNSGYSGTPTPSAICYKSGIKEPQLAPVIGTQNTSVPFGGIGSLSATTIPWTNYNTANSSFNYGETWGFPNPGTPNPKDGTAPFIINCQNASYITITALSNDGPVKINGTTNPTLTDQLAGRVGVTFPGQFSQNSGVNTHPTTASYIVGAFMDANGNVITTSEYGWVAPNYVPVVVDVGLAFQTSSNIAVPYGAVTFQVGINSAGNTFTQGGNPNSGIITFSGSVTTTALPAVTSILGTMTAYYWGDSPAAVGANNASFYIWKNPSDSGGSGPTRTTSDAVGNTTGNSFIFDATIGPTPAGIPQLPGLGPPDSQTVPMIWYTLNPESVITGQNSVFAAPITATYPNQIKYNDFNFCLTGNIYFPSGGPGVYYTLVLTNKDDCIWGIGGGVTLVPGSVSISGNNEGSSASISGWGQTITVVGGYPLLPRQNYIHGDNGTYAQTTLQVNPPATGIYPIEIDYDYWYHNNRILLLMASPTAGASPTIIPPLPANIRQDVQYRYVYRSTATGAQSNPSPESTAEAIPVTANTITSLWSPDPQVDVVDYYRLDSVTTAFTYVNTGPNDNNNVSFSTPGNNTPVTDSLLDTELGTQTLDYDNYEPFPSIDLPQKGICNVSGGVITWFSGGAIGGSATGFNSRWLAGTTILIGSPTSLAYIMIARPVSNTITIPGVPDGTRLAYQIPQPILANQPLPFMWGPTDNINFCFAVGDLLRQGTLYWCKGANLDSAPDTNQLEVTDPGEPLVNGAIAGGLGVLFSIKRGWLIMPNFGSATATATGTTGSTWTLQESSITRGLYIPRCVCVSGGGNIFFRVDDGIHVSSYGSASQSITDQDLYPIFQHENSAPPSPVTIAGYTVYPPDDTQPNKQKFSYQNGFVYYDYVDTTNVARTLVFDEQAMGWVIDVYTPTATIHAPDEGESVGDTLVGCSDGTVRLMSSAGTEVATAVLLTPAFDAGDTRAEKKFGDLYIESTNP